VRSRLDRAVAGEVTEPAPASPTWRVVYAGRPDKHSASGVAQPSWHVFDRRVWRKDLGSGAWLEIELTNLQVRVAGKGAYRVVLRRGAGSQSEDLVWEEGHDWGRLVREMKARREAQG
jgi:hypothetical protein